MIEITITQRGPALSVEEMRDITRRHDINPTDAHLEFLVKIGNGGYVEEDVALPTPVKGHPEFEVREFKGIGHSSPYLDLVTVVESYRIDDQLPPDTLPVITDSGNVHICSVRQPVEGCSLVYWSPVDGFPEKLFPVAVDFDDLCEKFFYCQVDRSPLTFWERVRARRWF